MIQLENSLKLRIYLLFTFFCSIPSVFQSLLTGLLLSNGWKGMVLDTSRLLELYSHSHPWSGQLQRVRSYLLAFKERESKQQWRWKPSLTSATQRSYNMSQAWAQKRRRSRVNEWGQGLEGGWRYSKLPEGREWVKEAGEGGERLVDEMKCPCWKEISQVPRGQVGTCCISSGKVINMELALVSVEGIFE